MTCTIIRIVYEMIMIAGVCLIIMFADIHTNIAQR